MKTVKLLLLTTSVVVLFFTLTPQNIISLQTTDENRDLSSQKSIRHQTIDAGLLSNGVHEEWVRHYMSESHPSFDFAKAMVVDESGNIYVTGQSQSTTTLEDFLTIKYDAQGNEIWTARYRDGYRSQPVSIATDHFGNVCVLGKSMVQTGNSTPHFDLVTIKYDRDGKEQWVAKFGNTRRDDEPVGILLDSLGHNYVAGNILDDDGYIKSTLIKYDGSGKELWVARLDGEANAHAIDSKGNIYLTGKTFLAGHESDYLTAKFNQYGEKQWVATYNGPADQRDESCSIVVDNFGNSYVTGATTYLQNRIFYKTQYTTIKYDITGQEKWIAQYTGVDSSFSEGIALALDQIGNIYVTGKSIGNGSRFELTTVKYNNFGEEQWVVRFPNNERPFRTAKFIFTDKSENIYVAAEVSDDGTNSADFVTIKYNPQGIQQWAAIFDGPDHYRDQVAMAAFDQSANLYVTGTSDRSPSIPGSALDKDFVTVKYDSIGNQKWVKYYPGPGISYDRAAALAINTGGDVYVTGNGYIGAKAGSYLTIKYNEDGEELWIASSNRPDSTANFSKDIAVDEEGNVFVLGHTKTNSTGQDFFLVKYNSNGIEQWTVQKGGYANFDDEPLALALDAYANIIVTGTVYRKDSANDYMILKYNPLGALLWESYYTGPNKASDCVSGLATDAFGNIYITGKSWEGGEQYNYATIKYSGAGIEQWVAKYAGPSQSDDETIAVVVDDSGNVYLSGGSEKDSYNHSQFEFITIKYDSNGVEQWTARYKPSLEGGYSRVTNMAIDKKGNVYIIGSDRVEYVTIKYDSQGIETWVYKYTILALNSFALPKFIRIDEADEIYVGGFGSRLIVLKHSEDGAVKWMTNYQGPGFLGNMMADFEIDHSGNIYVTSEGDQNFSHSVFTTIKYSQDPVLAIPSDGQIEISKRYTLEQNYPNPFNPSTTIRYFLSKQSHVKLQMFSVSGKEIATLIDEEKTAGRHDYILDASKLPSGIYIYRLKVDGFISTKKMLLLR